MYKFTSTNFYKKSLYEWLVNMYHKLIVDGLISNLTTYVFFQYCKNKLMVYFNSRKPTINFFNLFSV